MDITEKIKIFINLHFEPFHIDEVFIIERGLNIICGTNNSGKTRLLQNIQSGNYEDILGISFFNLELELKNKQTNTSIAINGNFKLKEGSPRTYFYNNYALIQSPNSKFVIVHYDDNHIGQSFGSIANIEINELFKNLFPMIFPKKIKYFRSATPFRTKCGHESIFWESINEDGSNLSAIISTLHEEPRRSLYKKYLNFLKMVFPEIQSLYHKNNTSNQCELFIQIDDKEFPLSSCGAGIAQGAFLLYVTLFAPEDYIVLFDETFEYIHPKATKMLLQIIKEHSKAYAIYLATHEPTAVKSPYVDHVYFLKRDDKFTSINLLDENKIDVINSLGLEYSDLAIANKIVIVEGKTEENILQEMKTKEIIDNNIGIFDLEGIGSIKIKKKDGSPVLKTIKKIKDSLSMNYPIKMIIDADDRQNEDLNRIIINLKKNGIDIKQISRAMIENYFLEPPLINLLLHELAEKGGFTLSNLTSHKIEEILNKELDSDDNFYPKSKKREKREENIKRCRGDIVLSNITKKLSDNRIEYQKAEHGYLMFTLGLEQQSDSINELIEEYKGLIEQDS